jgi:DNA repair protein RadD
VIQWAGKTFLEPQTLGVNALMEAIRSGSQRIVFTSPTGTGKTLMVGYSAAELIGQQKKVHLQTYRRLLLNQLSGEMTKFGVEHGIRASGMSDQADASRLLQLVMTQTELSYERKRLGYQRQVPDVLFLDEAHNQLSGDSGAALTRLREQGAIHVDVTATPIGPFPADAKLIEVGKNSEFRRLGLLLPCKVYGPDEPEEALKLKPTKTGEFREGDVVKAIMSPTIFGRALEWYGRLNPDRKPAILFGPGVKESIWFAEQFRAAGIRAAHIDGEHVWIDGESHNKSQSLVDEIRRESEAGKIQVVCNRFVMREGLDWPHLYHAILATVFGSLTGFLQSIGRLLRAYPGMEHVIMQDHGGNWWRHGSPNADRNWTLGWDANRYAQERAKAIREKKEPEPIVCVKCGAVRLSGPTCVTCGHTSSARSRVVIQTNGTLREISGEVFKRAPERDIPKEDWIACHFRCKKSGRTQAQAEGLFYKEHGFWPDKHWPYMLKDRTLRNTKIQELDWRELVPRERVKA